MTHAPRRMLPVLALAVPLVLVGCGGTAGSGAGSSTSGASSASAASSGAGASAASGSRQGTPTGCGTDLKITVKGTEVTPPPATVDVHAGCAVQLTVTADRTSQVHVHVIDLEEPITAGRPETLRFTPTQQGVYEVELHDPDLLLVKLAVR